MFPKRMASIIPSGKPGFITRMMTASAPMMMPYIHFPVSVRAEVTGSVAMNTAPKQNPPMMMC